jgi:hypothetical protein
MNTNISDNANSKVLSTAIREVQDFELQEIIGEILLDKLCQLIIDGTIEEPENKIYKDVLDKSQMFIAYKVIAKLTLMFSYKIDNAGVVQSRDEFLDSVGMDDVLKLNDMYTNKADHYCYLLQNFIMSHLSELPEVTEFQAWKIHSTLYSAASSGVFLGGARGKGWFRVFPYRLQRYINMPGHTI